MPISLYFDVHVDFAIISQLRLRQVDCLTAQEDRAAQLTDEELLIRASSLRRPLITHDIRFEVMAWKWQAEGRPFCGLIYGHMQRVTIGQCVRDLEIIAKSTELTDWQSQILRLPL